MITKGNFIDAPWDCLQAHSGQTLVSQRPHNVRLIERALTEPVVRRPWIEGRITIKHNGHHTVALE